LTLWKDMRLRVAANLDLKIPLCPVGRVIVEGSGPRRCRARR